MVDNDFHGLKNNFASRNETEESSLKPPNLLGICGHYLGVHGSDRN